MFLYNIARPHTINPSYVTLNFPSIIIKLTFPYHTIVVLYTLDYLSISAALYLYFVAYYEYLRFPSKIKLDTSTKTDAFRRKTTVI